MFGRVLTVVLTPLWLALVLLILALALVIRLLRGTADVLEVVGNAVADGTKGVIEVLSRK